MALVCFYAFMRTTVVLPPDLLRAAKARSAERGESLKALLERALTSELSMPAGRAGSRGARVPLPLFGDPAGPKVRITNRDLAASLAGADAARFAAEAGTRPRRRKRSGG
jgi:hypothetical protein